MAEKIVSYYSAAHETLSNGIRTLLLEIANEHIACLTKNLENGEVTAFEFFKLSGEVNEWSDVFYEVKLQSRLLNEHYANKQIYYNTDNALILPEGKVSAATDMLSFMYGDGNNYRISEEYVATNNTGVTAYRIKQSLHEQTDRHFYPYQAHHIFSPLVAEAVSIADAAVIRLQIYQQHAILIVAKQQQIHLACVLTVLAPEDILYHLLNTIKQFDIDAASVNISMCGLWDTDTTIHKKIKQIFPSLLMDTTGAPSDITDVATAPWPQHFFTPFFKLPA